MKRSQVLKLMYFSSAFGVLLHTSVSGGEWDAYTAIGDVQISNPTANEVWLMDTPHVLTCSAATDEDRWRSSPTDDWIVYGDSVTHYWTGNGQFKNNNNVGTSVDYIAPQPGQDTVTVYADDDYAATGNTAYVDESADSDTETITIVGCEVHEVGFTGDHTLFETPAAVWDDGANQITDPIWKLGDPNNAKRNHVCYTKGATGTATFKCRVPQALTEGSSFAVGAYSGTVAWTAATVAIAAGATESNQGSCTANQAFVNKIFNGSLGLDWKFKCANGANVVRDLNSTSHRSYLTWAAPNPGGAESTVKRIDHVTSHCNGNTTEYQLADNLQDAAGAGINTGHNHSNMSDDWILYYGVKEAECDEAARFMVRQLKMIGSTGSAYNTYASTDANVRSMETVVAGGITYKLLMDFDLNGVTDNNFEGSVSAGGHYWSVWPAFDSDSEVGLLNAITCKQWWAKNLGGPNMPGSTEVPKPSP